MVEMLGCPLQYPCGHNIAFRYIAPALDACLKGAVPPTLAVARWATTARSNAYHSEQRTPTSRS
jgi:hypothetical protein